MSADRDLKDDLLDARDGLVAISRWLDEAPVNAARTPLERMLLRTIKLAEENGEMVAEIIGLTGQNPRKGVTSDVDKVIAEALDTVVTGLGIVEHLTDNEGRAFGLLFEKLAKVHARMLALPSADEISSDVKIDKFLDDSEH
jgi:hypothetical protein